MNRAIATLNRLIAEEKAYNQKMRDKKDRSKQFSLKNSVEIKFKLPVKWRNILQSNAANQTGGNLSAYMRQLVEKELQK